MQTAPIAEQSIAQFIVRADGTAIDSENKLMWCRFALGQTWQNGNVAGKARVCSWHSAYEAANQFNTNGGFADYVDWRMPTIAELKQLFDKDAGNKAEGRHYLNHRVFPNNPPSIWSCTASDNDYYDVWILDFKRARLDSCYMGGGHSCLLVRDYP